jgi:hypothetical protein
MSASREFLVGLLGKGSSAQVSAEDFAGPHRSLLMEWQKTGLLPGEPGMHPVPSCPYCGAGVPYRMQNRYLCNRCRSVVKADHLYLWQFDVTAFLRRLAAELHVRGNLRKIDDHLWQLGTWKRDGAVAECFFQGSGLLSDAGRARLQAYRQIVLIYGLVRPSNAELLHGRCVSLLELLTEDTTVVVPDPPTLNGQSGNVRFAAQSGGLWVGDTWVGEVVVGSKEFFFLDRLAQELDQFVPYADLKRAVLQRSGCTDSTDEATFCHGLKSRIKKKWVQQIDRLIVTTNKADGYRLRGYVEML